MIIILLSFEAREEKSSFGQSSIFASMILVDGLAFLCKQFSVKLPPLKITSVYKGDLTKVPLPAFFINLF